MPRARALLLIVTTLSATATVTACKRRVDEPLAPARGDAAPRQTAPAAVTSAPPEPDPEWAELSRVIREQYTKHEHRIAMRDGARLFTTVHMPKDRSRRYPILMTRTPYGVAPYGVDQTPGPRATRQLQRFAPSAQLVKAGYIWVHQDVRGRMMSEGEFVDVRPHLAKKGSRADVDESSDTYDTVEWLLQHVPSHNGRVGLWGISYPGFYAAMGAVDAHPAVKAVSPQAPVTDWFTGDDFHHNGAFFLEDSFDFYASFGKPRPVPVSKMSWGFDYGTDDRYSFFLQLGPLANADKRHFKGQIAFWNDLMRHGTLDDFWKARLPLPHYRDIKPAMMTVGGLFDAEDLHGAVATYQAIERQSPRTESSLVLGPWRHGGWSRSDGDSLGDVSFSTKTSLFYRQKIEAPFFERHLRGDGKDKAEGKPVEAWVFETGVNEWHAYDSWPPREVARTAFWLQPGGKVGAARPAEASQDEYVSDPAKPVPHRSKVAGERGPDYMVDDQRFAASRPDVLVYQTGVIEEDLALAGPVEASLWVTTTGTDADFVVKLIDVYPDNYPAPEPNPREVVMGGYQQLVRGEVMRGKFRHSLERPEPFTPGEPALVRFMLPDVHHTFRPGHRLMVQVQSSWFPLVDRNPQTFVDIYAATEGDFKKATHRVLLGGERASGLTLPVLRGRLAEAAAEPR